MRSVFVVLAFGLFFTTSEKVTAQVGTSLQFNQVLYTSGGTVPAGKVWKIERIVNTNSSSTAHVRINGTNVGEFRRSLDGFSAGGALSQNYYPASTGPMWLPETTVLTSQSTRLMFSIIEFTVIP